MKYITEILDSFKNNLSALNSPLASFTNYSNIYIILRSIAEIISEQYSDLDNYYLNSFLSSATGEELDARAKDFRIVRGEGSPALGYVFVTSSTNTLIPANTILNSANGNYQFQTTKSATVNSIGTYIPISSILSTEILGINAGTILTSPFYPNVKFVVGNSIDILGNYIGGIEGGRSSENDLVFRDRIISQINNQSKGTIESIVNQLEELNISRFFIKEGDPVTGYFTIYVNTQEQSLIDLIEDSVMQVKPIGVAFEIKTIKTLFINLKFVITLISIDYAESVSQNIRSICSTYFENLQLGEELYPINLAVLCSNIEGILDIRIVDPSSNKIVPPIDTLLKVRDIDLTLRIGG